MMLSVPRGQNLFSYNCLTYVYLHDFLINYSPACSYRVVVGPQRGPAQTQGVRSAQVPTTGDGVNDNDDEDEYDNLGPRPVDDERARGVTCC